MNELRDGESLREFHERIIKGYPEEKLAPAVAFLRTKIGAVDAVRIRKSIAQDPDNWASPYHFGWGMYIRNTLRQGGYGEQYWPIWNLDDIYVPLVERAVLE